MIQEPVLSLKARRYNTRERKAYVKEGKHGNETKIVCFVASLDTLTEQVEFPHVTKLCYTFNINRIICFSTFYFALKSLEGHTLPAGDAAVGGGSRGWYQSAVVGCVGTCLLYTSRCV